MCTTVRYKYVVQQSIHFTWLVSRKVIADHFKFESVQQSPIYLSEQLCPDIWPGNLLKDHETYRNGIQLA